MGLKRKIERAQGKYVAGPALAEQAAFEEDVRKHGVPQNRKARRKQAARLRRVLWKSEHGAKETEQKLKATHGVTPELEAKLYAELQNLVAQGVPPHEAIAKVSSAEFIRAIRDGKP